MENQNTQVDMTPEEAKASLGIATYLQQQMLPQGVPIDPSESPEMGEGGDLELETEEVPEEDIKGEFEAFKKETQKMIKDEIGSIKEMIKSAISDEEK